jgi:hypothetical protein
LRFDRATFTLGRGKLGSGVDCNQGTASQAAEKGLNLREKSEKHPAGAKAQPLLSASCGTTKVVP